MEKNCVICVGAEESNENDIRHRQVEGKPAFLVIEELFGLQIDVADRCEKELPFKICPVCTKDLTVAYKLRCQILNTQKLVAFWEKNHEPGEVYSIDFQCKEEPEQEVLLEFEYTIDIKEETIVDSDSEESISESVSEPTTTFRCSSRECDISFETKQASEQHSGSAHHEFEVQQMSKKRRRTLSDSDTSDEAISSNEEENNKSLTTPDSNIIVVDSGGSTKKKKLDPSEELNNMSEDIDQDQDIDQMLASNARYCNNEEPYMNTRTDKDNLTQEELTKDIELSKLISATAEVMMFNIFYQLSNTPNQALTNQLIGTTLWKLPHPRFGKSFYEITRKPISMSKIRQNITNSMYSSFTALKADFEQMCQNYLIAYKPNHRLHVAASQMKGLLDQVFAPVLEPKGPTEENGTLATDTSSLMSNRDNCFNTQKPPIVTAASTTPAPIKPKFNVIAAASKLQFHAQQLRCCSSTQRITSQVKAASTFHNVYIVRCKLLHIHRVLLNFEIDGRKPIQFFTKMPLIQHIKAPIDMTDIEENIKANKYESVDEALADYRRMFSVAHQSNVEDSSMYKDLKILEKLLDKKAEEAKTMDIKTRTIKEIATSKVLRPIIQKPVQTTKIIETPSVIPSQPPLQQSDKRIGEFYNIIRVYRVPQTSRCLSSAFLRLPSRSVFPEYYECVKKPISIEIINCKVKKKQYANVEQLYTDFMQMLRNACSYYNCDFQIFKDSIELQRVCFETLRKLKADNNVVPNVQRTVQDLMMCLFNALALHEDADGRLYADSLGDVPKYDIKNGQRILGISLDLIRMRLESGEYKRLDTLQADVFECLERVRLLATWNSQAFEDSIMLQKYFITKRDELCHSATGPVLSSPALRYSTVHLRTSVETLIHTKLAQEPVVEVDDDGTPILEGISFVINEKLYSLGDFVYYDCPEINVPGIMCIERLWMTNDNIPMMSGNLFLRPTQAIYSRTCRIFGKEVFKSDQRIELPLNKLQGKCYVMCVKSYFKLRPDGYLERDLYVCESRYNSRTHAFKKIKTWNYVTNKIRFLQRRTPIDKKRTVVMKVEKTNEELAEMRANVPLREKVEPNVPLMFHDVENELAFFDQYNLENGLLLKTGDFVYTESTESKNPVIVQVCVIFKNRDGTSFIRGPCFKHPEDLSNVSTQLFSKQEVLLPTLERTLSTSSILEKCSVMEAPAYTTRRPTEILEKDVYVCEYVYDEFTGHTRKLSKPSELQKMSHSQMVYADEVYSFPKPIILQKNLRQNETVVPN